MSKPGTSRPLTLALIMRSVPLALALIGLDNAMITNQSGKLWSNLLFLADCYFHQISAKISRCLLKIAELVTVNRGYFGHFQL